MPDTTASLGQVSGFQLDTFEVTVGRYRAFIDDYDRWRREGNPVAGAAANPRLEGSGWQASWSALLPVNSAALEQSAIVCLGNEPSTLESASSEAAPVNCVSWYEALAFCAWDGGRLPTQLEWEYAAAGGSEQRLYPWGDAPAPSDERASFGCMLGQDDPSCPAPGPPPAVGARPLGAGRWGQEDLAGSMAEWLFDAVGQYPPECLDCAIVDGAAGTPSVRTFRGGSWGEAASALEIGARSLAPPSFGFPLLGLRCARDTL